MKSLLFLWKPKKWIFSFLQIIVKISKYLVFVDDRSAGRSERLIVNYVF